MNRRLVILGILVLMAVSFLAGAWISYRTAKQGSSAGGRKILHYVDPMHPSYTSDKPGIAPDCGMPLEPVYADGTIGSGSAALPPGTVQVSPEKLQTIGVKIGTVERSGGSQLLRLPGRIAVDETKTYVINATIDGWITSVGSNTTGSFVRKNEVLATFYSSEFLSAGQALLYALTSMDRVQGGSPAANQQQKDQMQQFNLSLKQYRDSLRNLGMGDRQIDKMIRTRTYMENIDIDSPASGLVLVRNVSPGQRFERGKELYRIADISRVWVLVDTYGAEVDQMKPGRTVMVSLPGRNRTFRATVSKVPPVFDAASRTLKVRLEMDNPGAMLRPDMFVDVELPVTLPEMLAVPSEAVLDSGLKKTVYVEKSAGLFEPREVETGRSVGNRVEIVSGLKPGERIVVSGTFLIDSESRMKTAASGITGPASLDPACGMYVDEAKARAAGNFLESGGTTYYFCSDTCKRDFLKKGGKPSSTTGSPGAKPTTAPMHDMHGAGHDHGAMEMSANKGGMDTMPTAGKKAKSPADEGMTHTGSMQGSMQMPMPMGKEAAPMQSMPAMPAGKPAPQPPPMTPMQGAEHKHD